LSRLADGSLRRLPHVGQHGASFRWGTVPCIRCSSYQGCRVPVRLLDAAGSPRRPAIQWHRRDAVGIGIATTSRTLRWPGATTTATRRKCVRLSSRPGNRNFVTQPLFNGDAGRSDRTRAHDGSGQRRLQNCTGAPSAVTVTRLASDSLGAFVPVHVLNRTQAARGNLRRDHIDHARLESVAGWRSWAAGHRVADTQDTIRSAWPQATDEHRSVGTPWYCVRELCQPWAPAPRYRQHWTRDNHRAVLRYICMQIRSGTLQGATTGRSRQFPGGGGLGPP
jgi:hypothetical protein